MYNIHTHTIYIINIKIFSIILSKKYAKGYGNVSNKINFICNIVAVDSLSFNFLS